MPRKIYSLVVIVTCFLFFSSCDSRITVEELTNSSVKRYLSDIITTMQNNSVNRKIIDWNAFRTEVMSLADDAQTIPDATPAILRALELLNDNHSFFVPEVGFTIRPAPTKPYVKNIAMGTTIPSDVGYIKVRGYSGSTAIASHFVEQIQNEIRRQDHQNIKGWVVDLTENTGGNMWPMLDGLSPILGNGIAGYFIDPDGVETSWSIKAGLPQYGETPKHTNYNNRYQLISPNPKVAVIISGTVGSSGEAVTISFIKRSNTRLFGKPTYGISTANTSYNFGGFGELFLTISTLADREKTLYGNEILPDEDVTMDTVLDRAIEWLKE